MFPRALYQAAVCAWLPPMRTWQLYGGGAAIAALSSFLCRLGH
jgi:hypothetical protein